MFLLWCNVPPCSIFWTKNLVQHFPGSRYGAQFLTKILIADDIIISETTLKNRWYQKLLSINDLESFSNLNCYATFLGAIRFWHARMRWIGIWRRKLPNFWRILTMLLSYSGLCTTSVAARERSKFRISNAQVSTGLRFKSYSATLLRKCRWVWLTSCNKNMQWKYLARPKNELVLELQHFRWTRSVWQNLANQLTRYTYIYICLNI